MPSCHRRSQEHGGPTHLTEVAALYLLTRAPPVPLLSPRRPRFWSLLLWIGLLQEARIRAIAWHLSLRGRLFPLRVPSGFTRAGARAESDAHLSRTFRSLPERALAVVNSASANRGVHAGPDFICFFQWGTGNKYL